MKGFQSTEADELKVQAIVRRLTPAARRKDDEALHRGVNEAIARYGKSVAADAYAILALEHNWIMDRNLKLMPKESREEFTSQAIEAMAETLTEEGLRLEDHLRVADFGIALTREAIAAIKATDFDSDELGEGNESLQGVGVCRSPYFHPLSEKFPAGTEGISEPTVNSWATVSFVLNSALGWMPIEPGDEIPNPAIARETISNWVSSVAPTVAPDKLMHRSRYDDRVLLKLNSLKLRRQSDLNRRIEVLQTSALPLGYAAA